MLKKNIILLSCIVLILLGGVISTNLLSNSKEKVSVKTIEKVNKFPSVNDVSIAKIYEKNVGPHARKVFYFDLELSEHKKFIANILSGLNADDVKLNDAELKQFYGYGGYSPASINLQLKNGTSLDITASDQNLVINGYYKEKSLVVSNCTNLIELINTGWQSIKQDMKQDTE